MKKLTILALVVSILVNIVPASSVKANPGKLVCITFDDTWESQYINAFPILQTHGFYATFAIITTWIGGGTGAKKVMTMSEIQDLADHGMDIASHTRTHLELTDNVTQSQLD